MGIGDVPVVEIAPGCRSYPAGLEDLEDPPHLFVDGALPAMPAVAVVGTRRCTRYGIDLAEAFGGAIARCGWSTVSGLARGIDAAAHRGCLATQGHATAVLGSGIDVCYPKENLPIFEQIRSTGGAIVSEYPSGTPPDRWRFPARNRIIAAISSVVVVVEAAARGGALITARLAAEIGRPVFAVPGDVDRPASEGCNLLLRDGAHPVLGAEDLITEVGLVVGPPKPPQGTRDTPDRGVGAIPDAGADVSLLGQIWSLNLSDVLVQITRLEVEGLIRKEGSRVYRR